MQQRKQEFKDLLNALQIMRIVDNNTPKPQLFLAMWLIEIGNLKYDTNLQVITIFILKRMLFQLDEKPMLHGL